MKKVLLTLILIVPLFAGEAGTPPPATSSKNSVRVKKDYFVDKDRDGINDSIKDSRKIGDYIMEFLKKSRKKVENEKKTEKKTKSRRRRH